MITRKFRVAHVTEAFIGGIGKYLEIVLPKQIDHGVQVTLFCSPNRGNPRFVQAVSSLQRVGVDVREINMCRAIRVLDDCRALWGLFRTIRRGRFDLIHTHGSKGGALGRLSALIAGCPVVHTPHCFAFARVERPIERLLYLSLERMLGKMTTHLICVSRSETRIATRFGIVPSERCSHVNNGLPPLESGKHRDNSAARIEAREHFGVPQDAKVVLTACRLVKYKGILRVLEAAKICRTPDALFVIAGDGEMRSVIEDFIEESGLSSRVKLVGYVDEIEKLYAMADMYVLCSEAEGQPYSLLEAMQARCPIVATAVPGIRDVVTHGKTGFLTRKDPAALAHSIDLLLGDPLRRREYARNAYRYCIEHHYLDNQVSQLVELYRRTSIRRKMSRHGTASCCPK